MWVFRIPNILTMTTKYLLFNLFYWINHFSNKKCWAAAVGWEFWHELHVQCKILMKCVWTVHLTLWSVKKFYGLWYGCEKTLWLAKSHDSLNWLYRTFRILKNLRISFIGKNQKKNHKFDVGNLLQGRERIKMIFLRNDL